MLTPLTRRTQSATALPWCRRLIPPCYVTEGRLTPIPPCYLTARHVENLNGLAFRAQGRSYRVQRRARMRLLQRYARTLSNGPGAA